jgi:hypothetical protein
MMAIFAQTLKKVKIAVHQGELGGLAATNTG